MEKAPPWTVMIVLTIGALAGGKSAITRAQTGLAKGVLRAKMRGALTSATNIEILPIDMRGGPVVVTDLLITNFFKFVYCKCVCVWGERSIGKFFNIFCQHLFSSCRT